MHTPRPEEWTIPRKERRRQYRRRMTLDSLVDPLVDPLVDGTFLDDGNGGGEVDGGEGGGRNAPAEDASVARSGDIGGVGTVGDADGSGTTAGAGHQAGSSVRQQRGILVNRAEAAYPPAAANPDRNGDGAENYSELRLLGELLGRYTRSGSQDDFGSSDGTVADDNNNGNSNDPPQPARNHSYLPTAQPLYPEDWIPAGRHHRHRLGRGDSDMSVSMLDEVPDSGTDTGEEDGGGDQAFEGAAPEYEGDARYVLDGESDSPYRYDIPPPPGLCEKQGPGARSAEIDEDEDATAQRLHTLAVMEMDDVVLFPGSIVPLRLRDRNWVSYLGALIDDARGLYGPHRGTAGGMGEVRIAILPRVTGGERRTRRRPRGTATAGGGAGGGQEGGIRGGGTGRWRVDLIRRGVAGAPRRRRRSGRARRRRVSEATEMDETSIGNGTNRERGREGAPSIDDGWDASRSPRYASSERPSSSSDDEGSEEEEDDLFHPSLAGIRSPAPPDADPLVGRIGTAATITFTHEETAASSTQNPDLLNVAGGQSPGGQDRRSSSVVWRNRGEELVLTILGTNRVRLLRLVKDEKSTRGQHASSQIPLYAVEEMVDGIASPPPSWMMRAPGNVGCSVATASLPESSSNSDNEEGVGGDGPVLVARMDLGREAPEGGIIQSLSLPDALLRNDDVEGSGNNDCSVPNVGTDSRRAAFAGRDIHISAIRNLSLRTPIPAFAYLAVWPWRLCKSICNMIQETDDFQGLGSILHTAAGLRYDHKHDGEDMRDSASADVANTTLMLPPIEVMDPSAFADWMATNMPLSRNDRINLLETTCTVRRLRFVLRKLEEKKRETILRCEHCGAVVSWMRHVFSVGGSEGTTGAYVNEHGVVHQTVTLRKVDSRGVVCIGRPETRESWFPGYSWQIAYCSICSDHLGWKFRRVDSGRGDSDDPNRPRTFWGFSSITTDEHVRPRRVAFHTRRAIAVLLQHD